MPRSVTSGGRVYTAKAEAEHSNIHIIRLCTMWLEEIRDPVKVHLLLRFGLGEVLCRKVKFSKGVCVLPIVVASQG